MAKYPKITFSDLADGRQVANRFGMNSVELMRVVREHTQKQGMGDREFQAFAEKVFSPETKNQ